MKHLFMVEKGIEIKRLREILKDLKTQCIGMREEPSFKDYDVIFITEIPKGLGYSIVHKYIPKDFDTVISYITTDTTQDIIDHPRFVFEEHISNPQGFLKLMVDNHISLDKYTEFIGRRGLLIEKEFGIINIGDHIPHKDVMKAVNENEIPVFIRALNIVESSGNAVAI